MTKRIKDFNPDEYVLKRNLTHGETVYYTDGVSFTRTNKIRVHDIEELVFDYRDGKKFWFRRTDENGKPDYNKPKKKLYDIGDLSKNNNLSRDRDTVVAYREAQKDNVPFEAIAGINVEIERLQKLILKIEKEHASLKEKDEN